MDLSPPRPGNESFRSSGSNYDDLLQDQIFTGAAETTLSLLRNQNIANKSTELNEGGYSLIDTDKQGMNEN